MPTSTRIYLSVARAQLGKGKYIIVKILVHGKRFLYTSSRGKDMVSAVVPGIKLRGVNFTHAYITFDSVSFS